MWAPRSLIATFGRTVNRRRAAIKYFLYTFIPSAILLVAILWLLPPRKILAVRAGP